MRDNGPLIVILIALVAIVALNQRPTPTPKSGLEALSDAYVVCSLDELGEPAALPVTFETTKVATYSVTKLTPQSCTLHTSAAANAATIELPVTLIWAD